ncbi:MAG: DUF2778 domain-containing protein [Desulfobacterales bacterium]|nr:DUF2778 domain-containing protein [Desulfobacterales bacterium]
MSDHPNIDYFRLESIDNNYGDDTHDRTGRDKFRIHKFGSSEECITALDDEQWKKLRDMIRNTKTSRTQVKSKSRNPFAPKNEDINKFGEIRVIDTSKMP